MAKNPKERRPAAVATWEFGGPAVQAARWVLAAGGTALDAVEAGINVAELDPEVSSVGYGGLPNSAGVVELDAAVMVGPGHRAGSVAGLRGIRRAISVARCVMEQSPHVMLVGEEARRFALERGFVEEDLLTSESLRRWQEWQSGTEGHDTIGLVALDAAGHVAAGCSTSGLAFKLPGRVGDSPLIGSGLYADEAVGAAAATGVGEEIMKFCASFLAVEFMRHGASPREACARVIERILAKTPSNAHVPIALIAVSRTGECGAASTRPDFPYAVWTPHGTEMREA